MKRFPRAARSPIGVDVGSHSVKAAQLVPRSDGGWAVERLACFPRRAPAAGRVDHDEAVRLRTVLRRLGFKGDQVVMAVPADASLTAVLELPPRGPGVPIEQIARGEFARAHSRDGVELEVAFWDLPEPARAAKATHLMAVGCPTADADALLETMGRAGLRVVAIDQLTSALSRACAPLAAAPPATTAVLDLGWSAASLALLASGVLIYERRMPEVAGRLLHEAVAKQFALDPEEAALLLAQAAAAAGTPAGDAAAAPAGVTDVLKSHAHRLSQELRLAFSYVARQYTDATVGHVLLAGGGAAMPAVAAQMTRELEVECRPVSPASLAADAATGPSTGRPEMSAAMGLAMFPLGSRNG